MHRIARILVCLLIGLLPLQGYATATLHLCNHAAHERLSALATDHSHHALLTDNAQNSSDSFDPENAPDDCTQCKICVGVSMLSMGVDLSTESIDGSAPTFFYSPPFVHIPDLLHRPPRLHLA